MAQLAIKGHATRGREVIELLEMMGGKNINRRSGYTDEYVYVINHSCEGEIDCFYIVPKIYEVFSLDEFYEKFPYKVGDKVSSKYLKNYKIEKMEWEDTNNRVIYKLQGMGWYSTDELQPDKEETMEGKLISKEEMSLRIDTSQMEKRQIIFSADAPNETELVLGDNFEIKVEDGKTYVVRKKPQYPKTYVECAKILDCFGAAHIDGYKCELLEKFQELLVCRDAYWKIAGDWKPDWRNNQFKYVIVCGGDNIINDTYTTKNCILAFPTSEMRDVFYKNFKDLIESCKELL